MRYALGSGWFSSHHLEPDEYKRAYLLQAYEREPWKKNASLLLHSSGCIPRCWELYQDVLLGVDTPFYVRELRFQKQEAGADWLLTEGPAARFVKRDLKAEGHNVSRVDPWEDEWEIVNLYLSFCTTDPSKNASWQAACKSENSGGTIEWLAIA